MKHLLLSCILLAASHVVIADIPVEYRGDWLLVNGTSALRLDESGSLTSLTTGEKGKLDLKPDGSFTAELSSRPQSGRFADGKLFLKNEVADAPAWLAFLEFRRSDETTTTQLIEFVRRQQNEAFSSLAKVHRSSIEKAIKNNLRQLDAACSQYFLEQGSNSVKDYATLDLDRGVSWKITTKSGITVEYRRTF